MKTNLKKLMAIPMNDSKPSSIYNLYQSITRLTAFILIKIKSMSVDSKYSRSIKYVCLVFLVLVQSFDLLAVDSAYVSQVFREYVSIPSMHGHEKLAGEYLNTMAKKLNLEVRVLTDKDSSYNLMISMYPLAMEKPNIILISHMDVVGIGISTDWRFPPFESHTNGDTLWGRGAVDNKSNTIMHLFALHKFSELYKKFDLDYNVSLLVLSDEENGGLKGSIPITDQYMKLMNPVLAIGEGPFGINQVSSSNPGKYFNAIAVDNKRLMIMEMRSNSGEGGAHACLSNALTANHVLIKSLDKLLKSKNTISFNGLTISMLKKMGEEEKGFKRFVLMHPKLFQFLIKAHLNKTEEMSILFNSTHTVTRIENPGCNSNNSSAQHAIAIIDCRVQPHISSSRFKSSLWSGMSTSRITLNQLYQSPNAQPSSVDSKFYQIISKRYQKLFPDAVILPAQVPYFSDCVYFRSKGVPVYSFIPVQLPLTVIQSAHAKDEHFLLSALCKGKDAYISILEALIDPKKDMDLTKME